MFDVVFCRNVLIYFDQETKIDVLDRIAAVTEPDGYLVLGAAETVVGLTDRVQAGRRQARPLRAQPGRPSIAGAASNVVAAACPAQRRRARADALRGRLSGFSTILPIALR